MKLDYKFLKFPDGRRRPFVPLNIINPHTKQERKFYCLLDTGADDSLFNVDTASSLGHNINGRGVKSSIKIGISGKNMPVWQHTFEINCLSCRNSELF